MASATRVNPADPRIPSDPPTPTPEPQSPSGPPSEPTRRRLPMPPDSQTVSLSLLAVPAARGITWVRQGLQVFARRPLPLGGLFAMFLFVALLLMVVPLVGAVAVLMALPLVSLGFMLATQAIVNDRVPMPGIFLAPLRTDRTRRIALLQLGLAYAVASFVVVALTDWIDGGTFEALQAAMASSSAETRDEIDRLLADPQLQTGIALRLLLAAALGLMFWHAPALVHWGGQGAAQALFSSTLACWRNKGAFVAFASSWVVLAGGIVLAMTLVARMLQMPVLMTAIVMPTVLLLSTVFYASLFFTFDDCFGAREPPRTQRDNVIPLRQDT